MTVLGSDPPSDAPPQNFQAIVRQAALDAVRAHADAQPEVEVCDPRRTERRFAKPEDEGSSPSRNAWTEG